MMVACDQVLPATIVGTHAHAMVVSTPPRRHAIGLENTITLLWSAPGLQLPEYIRWAGREPCSSQPPRALYLDAGLGQLGLKAIKVATAWDTDHPQSVAVEMRLKRGSFRV